jgi:ribosome biogenesis GTPase
VSEFVDLAEYGLDDRLREAFEAVRGQDALLGRVLRVERGECDLITPDGQLRVASDSARSQSSLAPATGDWVSAIDDPDVGPVIDTILERSATLMRRDPSEEGIAQVLVANVDRVAIVHGLDRPLRAGRLERFLVLIWSSGADAMVILTKSDVGDPDDALATVRSVAPDAEVLVASPVSGAGMDDVISAMPPRSTTALVGESGSGKSTLTNAMSDGEVQDVGEVRRGDKKGRHTTITRDLVRLSHGGLVVDTPGVRAVGLWDGHDALQRVFGDVIELAADCRFNDCAHGVEPGCAVRDAVERDDLSERRLERFAAMSAELDSIDERNRKRSGGRR